VDDLQMDATSEVSTSESALPYKTFALHQNYPNPFNPETIITFHLERPEHTNLTVYNALGQRVTVLVDAPLEAGRHRMVFSAEDDRGGRIPSGVYVYRLRTSAGSETRTMVLVR